jgi:thiol:disulfide interchange protein DsbD
MDLMRRMDTRRPGAAALPALAAGLALLASPGGASAQAFSSARVLKARALASVDRVHPGTSFQIAVVAEVEKDWHINAHRPSFDYLIPTVVSLDPVPGLTFREPVYPAHLEKAFAFTDGKPLRVYEGEVLVGVDVAVAADVAPGPLTLKGAFSAQACNDVSCLAPGKIPIEVPVAVASPGEAVALANQDVFKRIAFVPAGPGPGASERGSAVAPGDIGASIDRRGLLLSLPLILLGGLALNLTPCVYPLIPITVSYFGGQAAGRPLRTAGLASVYVLGMSVTYSALGAVAATTGGLLGGALQNPWVLGFVAAVMVALALSMFGFFEIAVPGFITNRIGARRGPAGALFMGLTVGLVAAPCIGPFVVGLLAYVGQVGSPALGFFLFFVLSLGLGLPFLVLGTFSGAAAALPRAGAWMVWVRNLFGCVLLGMALYFLRPVLPEAAARIAMGVLILGSGVFLGFFERSAVKTRAFGAARLVTAAAAAAAGVWVLAPGRAGAAETLSWRTFDEAILEEAARDGRPVIIDFTAEWCIACKELEHFTFSDPEVRAEASRFVTLRADLTSYASPPVEAVKRRFGILGLPWVVFLDATGAERPDLRVTGFVPPREFLERMRRAAW